MWPFSKKKRNPDGEQEKSKQSKAVEIPLEKLKQLNDKMTASEILALLGKPSSKHNVGAVMRQAVGFAPAGTERRDNWIYNTPYGTLRIEIEDNARVFNNFDGLQDIISEMTKPAE